MKAQEGTTWSEATPLLAPYAAPIAHIEVFHAAIPRKLELWTGRSRLALNRAACQDPPRYVAPSPQRQHDFVSVVPDATTPSPCFDGSVSCRGTA